MRKSQAPSLKVKFPVNSNEKNKPINNSSFKTSSGNDGNSVRSTENVLNLLLKTEKSDIDKDNALTLDSDLANRDTSKQNINLQKETSNTVEVLSKDSESSVIVFNVVYGKQTKKKHKTWEGNGFLEAGSKYLTLKDEDQNVIGTMPCPKARKLEEGERIYIGSKEVELLDIAEKRKSNLNIKPENKLNENLVKHTIIKTKPKGFGRRFSPLPPTTSTGLIFPEPNAQHQWYFNKKGLPITPVYIDEALSHRLREHQISGVTFLYECVMGFKDSALTGAILADEMGLGKTLQCIVLVWTLLKQGPYGNKPVINKALIVTPSSLTSNWNNEFIKWLGRVKLTPYVVNNKNRPSNMRGPVMIISYEMFVRYFEDIEKFEFGLLICDEGHRLKNTNIRTTQMLNRINCSRRIILTGTPIQNDLQEFYSLVDFVNPNVLGSPSEFRRRYEDPILASRQPNADEEISSKGKECAQELKRITSQFLLRRTRDILKNYLPPRHELVVFCKITEVQKKLYNSSISTYWGLKDNILGLCDGSVHLELISDLRKICSHPNLFSKEADTQTSRFNFGTDHVPAIEDSSKLIVTINFLRELQETSRKEKVILVSNSTQTLDLLEKILNKLGYSSCRLDGTTPAAQRNDIVERFNLSYCNSFVFLLSAKAGGVGLNLTGASRLILYDSDWNPATDLQAIARIWRDGQKYPVFIYRLLTTGTIEEKIYQRQICKQGLCEGTIDPENAKSIKLCQEDIKDIFSSCCTEKDCLTHDVLACDCSKQGEIPVPEIEPEERSGQLIKETKSSLKISELFHWEHHGPPFDEEFLSELCLKRSQDTITFIFRNCKN